MIDDELTEEDDSMWNDHGPQWVRKEGKRNGFVSTLTRMVSVLPEGKPLWGDYAGRWISKEWMSGQPGGRGVKTTLRNQKYGKKKLGKQE